MNKVIERVVKVPTPTKVAVLGGAVILLTALNWFLVISDLDGQIVKNRQVMAQRERDLIDKKVIADNLKQYEQELQTLEQQLAQAMTELPPTADIEGLLQQLNEVGRKAGLDILTLEPGREAPQTFYAAVPIQMEVAGAYHEIAVFFEAVSKLRRIINITNLSFGAPKRESEKVVLKARYLATTFRFVEQKQAAASSKKK